MAEGFLHAFEGWFIFMACLGILFTEVWVLSHFLPVKRTVGDLTDFSCPSVKEVSNTTPGARATQGTIIGILIVLVAALPLSFFTKHRSEVEPPRNSFAYFPLIKGNWIGRETEIEARVLDRLDLTDYIKAEYRSAGSSRPVELYIAYYASQRKGSSIHSPRSCIPGGGWEIAKLSQQNLEVFEAGQPLVVNRLVIAKGSYRQLVYYWFAQRGRIITNEYLAKFYLLWDALKINRSDGALVRVITSVSEEESLADADKRLQGFIGVFYPDVSSAIPGR